jgi:hypothetical protein
MKTTIASQRKENLSTDEETDQRFSEAQQTELLPRMIPPMFQFLLVIAAIALYVLKIRGISVLGVALTGWAISPECILFLAVICILAVQQLCWEIQRLESTKRGDLVGLI